MASETAVNDVKSDAEVDGPVPTVVVDDLHVVYRVFGAGGDKVLAHTHPSRVPRNHRGPIRTVPGVDLVSVLKLVESLESFVFQRRRSDSLGRAADVDTEKPAEIRS